MIICQFEDGFKVSLRHVTVDTMVLKDDKLLMVKRSAKLLEGGKWGLTGGFMDRDENLAQAAAREVYEESGWEIKNLVLLRVNDRPDRPREDRQNIVFAFFAEGVKQTGQPDWESDEVKWFPLDDLPPKERIAFDHADNIDLYKKYRRDKFSLPIIG